MKRREEYDFLNLENLNDFINIVRLIKLINISIHTLSQIRLRVHKITHLVISNVPRVSSQFLRRKDPSSLR